MRAVRVIAVLAVAVLLLLPEVRRYGAERQLFTAAAILRLVVSQPPAPAQRAKALSWVTVTMPRMARLVPGDPRPLMMTASARVLAGDAQGAMEWYAKAAGMGERPEIMLGAARIFSATGRVAEGNAALVRAAWVSPGLVSGLPEGPRELLESEIDRRAARLRQGDDGAIPPAPALAN